MERWLGELGLEPIERAERDGVHSWDLLLDGERRFDIRATLIAAPGVGLVCWLHYAPQLSDSFRKSYRKLLRWNDELLFAKFALSEDERLVLSAEVPQELMSRDQLGVTLCRLLRVCDVLLDESAQWIWMGPRPAADASRRGRNEALLARYAERVGDVGVEG